MGQRQIWVDMAAHDRVVRRWKFKNQSISSVCQSTIWQCRVSDQFIHLDISGFKDPPLATIRAYSPQPEGYLQFGHFELNHDLFSAMDGPGNHDFDFNEGLSFVVNCDTQEEIDHYWYKLTEGGTEGRCGWLKDPFGVSWQIVPSVLSKLTSDPNKAPKAVGAFMKMNKFDIQELIDAAES